MSDDKVIIAYKAFDEDWSCRGHRYEEGKTYEHEGRVELCEGGYHACLVPFDVWNYYDTANLARVELSGDTDGPRTNLDSDSKVCARKLHFSAKLDLASFVKAQAKVIYERCKSAKKALASRKRESAVNKDGHAAATGYSGHAAATGYSGHAAATGYSGHAAATGDRGHAAATGYSGHAAATGDRGHAAATGDRGHAAATGDRGHAAATGDSGHAAATGYSGHAAATGENSIAMAVGVYGKAKAATGSWIVLASYDDDDNITAVKSALAGRDVESDVWYRLNDGEFEKAE